ncbi:amino acid adenylation domain-containing protein [Streptomyces sp. R21]|uniref:Amino acid adenylation domain-containing protein n=1 Tax=Streptomyces sp. R21 TaxID=3238627 RepID=A0AB39PC54_9ACTN
MDQVYGSLPIAPEERARAARAALHRTEDYDRSGTVLDRVDRHAAARPDDAALVHEGSTVSYRELAAEVQRAAAGLAAAGVRGGGTVAVGGRRGGEVVTAFLALELLGAVYLPVDAAWPAARVEQVLVDSGAVLLVTTGGAQDAENGQYATSLRKGAAAADCPHRPYETLLSAGEPAVDGTVSGPAAPARRADPEEVRYLLYTSGSTGRPKGALIEQQGMLNHLWAKVQDLRLSPDDRVAQTAPLGFDISVWQMLTPLLIGGCVQFFSDEEAQDGAALLDAVLRRGTTVLETVPTLVRFLLDAADTGGSRRGFGALRWMIATGEELPPALARRWLTRHPGIGLLNAYGPTECSDDVTHAELTLGHLSVDGKEVAHLPIGGPVGNVSLYVLRRGADGWLACSRGEPGELFVGGVSVGRGYLGDPERTAAAFFADPFADAGGRLYRTGDAVRVLPSGELTYLGRVDRQVKLGGVRMELAEIEAVLTSHPTVAAGAVTVVRAAPQAALVARESAHALAPAEPDRLVAYVAPAPGASCDRQELLDHLAARLPGPMVPSTVVELSALPLTRNGKIDYAALPAPPRRERPAGLRLDPPVGPAEEGIARIVAELLGLDSVGRRDRFLALGGDSLMAMRLVARLRRLGSRATLREVLLDGSPAALAGYGWQTPTEAPSASLHTSSFEGERSRPLTPQQAGVYFHWRLDPESPYYSYQGSLLIEGPLDTDRLTRAWGLLLRENPLLLARFTEQDGKPEHSYPHWEVPLPPVETWADPAAYRELAFDEAARPFRLTEEPSVRLRLFRMGEFEHRLLVTMHEILIDGWGATVLFQRLAELYGAAADPEAEPGPEHTARYDRYLDWHEERLAAPETAEAGKYWQSRLSGPLPVLDIARQPRPSRPDYRGGIVEAVLDRRTATALREAAADAGGTPFVHLLAAYALALTYYGDAEEVVIGAPMANREHPEQADVPAFLLSMLPLRITVPADLRLGDFVAMVRDLVLEGFAAAEHPLGWTLRGLAGTARSGAATPVFQTMLNMLAYPSRETASDGVSFRFVELDTRFTKYDCALYAQPHGHGELLLQFAHQLQLLDTGAAEAVLASTLRALHALIDAPGTAIRDLNLLPGAEPSPTHTGGHS